LNSWFKDKNTKLKKKKTIHGEIESLFNVPLYVPPKNFPNLYDKNKKIYPLKKITFARNFINAKLISPLHLKIIIIIKKRSDRFLNNFTYFHLF